MKVKRKVGKMQLKKRICALVVLLYAQLYLPLTTVIYAADKKDVGVAEVTHGIDVLKEIVLAAIGGVGVIYLAWGLMDFGAAHSERNTGEQKLALSKAVSGLIIVAVPTIIALLT